jgi:hypothetical protein
MAVVRVVDGLVKEGVLMVGDLEFCSTGEILARQGKTSRNARVGLFNRIGNIASAEVVGKVGKYTLIETKNGVRSLREPRGESVKNYIDMRSLKALSNNGELSNVELSAEDLALLG